jgi:ABC-type nitrate/sulfonate/bicarbonate transport system permease component
MADGREPGIARAAAGTDSPWREIRFRGGGYVAAARPGAALIFFAGAIGFWELSVRAQWVSPLFLPAPSEIFRSLYDLAASGLLWTHVSISLFRIFGGWSLGVIAGLVVGMAMGVWSLARAIGIPFVSALFPIPKIALLPLLILWLGIGEASKIATIALGVFFPTVIAVYSGIDAVPRNLIRMAQSFDLPPRAVLWKIVLPGALPSILAGFRISASIALILLVAAEMIGAQYGIGAFILAAGNTMRTDQLMAGVALLSTLGLLIGFVLSRIERRLLRWR